MPTINKKDIEAFGRVLEALGIAIQKNPSLLNEFLQDSTLNSKESTEKEVDLDKIAQIPIFQLAKNSPEQLEDTLLGLSTSELKSLLKHNHLGGSNLKSRDSIIKFILDQLKKRTTDVFREHNSASDLTATIEVRRSSESQVNND